MVNPAGEFATFTTVSCPEPTTCFLGGTAPKTDTTPARAFLARWNGTDTTEVPLPLSDGDTTVDALSCPSPTSCLLRLTVPTTRPGTIDIAARTVRWDGTTAAPLRTPDGVMFEAGTNRLACGAPDRCMAVASQLGYPGIARWDGRTWTFSVLPSGAGGWPDVHGVACTGPSFCAAVGADLLGTVGSPMRVTTLVATWNGTLWSSFSPLAGQPDRPFILVYQLSADLMYQLSCSSPTWCVAFGEEYNASDDRIGQPVTLVWTGSGWHRGPPHLVDRVPLGFIDCAPNERWCIAGGSYMAYDVFQAVTS